VKSKLYLLTRNLISQIRVTKYHRLDGLNNRHLFFTVLEDGSLFLNCTWLFSCGILTWQAEKERKRERERERDSERDREPSDGVLLIRSLILS
jgi:hypothetical protein